MRSLFCRAGIATGGLLLCGSLSAAPVCFPATGKAGDDAQAIRLQAQTLGWSVGVPASMTAGGVIKGKVALYPKGKITICLSGDSDTLTLRAQASTGDDRDAGWKKLPARRTGV